MRLPDPLTLKNKVEKFTVSSGFAQEQGTRKKQEDAFLKEKEECFALADGVGGMPHGDVAAALAVESAIWTYTLTKLKPFYWNDKKLFAGRMYRTVNWRVFNKRREEGFKNGMASTLTVLLISDRKFYVYHVGDTQAFLLRDKKVLHLTKPDRDDMGGITKALGITHTGPIPSFITYDVVPGDIIVLATDGVADWVTDEEWLTLLEKPMDSSEGLKERAKEVLQFSAGKGSNDNRSVCIVSCVPGRNLSLSNIL